uniref:Prostate and testis expressed 2 n=1 Tax=Cavia porcellus TaxID=10141 RepID=H0VM60_CAVPO
MLLLLLLGTVLLRSWNWGAQGFLKADTTTMCYKCTSYQLGYCYGVMDFCILNYRQSCATENIYLLTEKGQSMYYYSKLSCRSNCENIIFLDFNKKTEVLCCKHSNYCNLPEGL